MAINTIHKITATINTVLNYCSSDKVEVIEKDDIGDSINYVMKDKNNDGIIYKTLFSCHNSYFGLSAYESMKININTFGANEIKYGNKKTKDGKAVLGYHLVQSFEKTIDPIIANELGLKMARELFPNFIVQVSTHTNTEHTHNHFVICAWDNDGKKYAQNNTSYDKIRLVSDRLCEEYGLGVLEETRKRKLVFYEDSNGNTRYFEPTNRKTNLIKARQYGAVTRIEAFRNNLMVDKPKNKRQTLKNDIDTILNKVSSYDELKTELRKLGYSIRDKKADGSNLEYISFKAIDGDRFIRDKSLDKTGYYLREKLEQVISTNVFKREYNAIDIQGSKLYKHIENDIKYSSAYQNKKDTSKYNRKNDIKLSAIDEMRLIDNITESVNSIRFIEDNKVAGYFDFNNQLKNTIADYEQMRNSVDTVLEVVKKLEYVYTIPKKIKAIESRIEKMTAENNLEYFAYDFQNDNAELEKFKMLLSKYSTDGVIDSELENKLKEFKEKAEMLSNEADNVEIKLFEFERVFNNLCRIHNEYYLDTDFELFTNEYNTTYGNEEIEEQEEKEEVKNTRSRGAGKNER